MARMNRKEIAELVGVTAIVASLIFVGIELRQARQIAVADIYQQRTAMLIELHGARLSSEPLAASKSKMTAGAELSDWETNLINTEHYLFFTYWENVHFQHEYGLMPEEQWQASRRSMKGYMRNNPSARDLWESIRFAMRDSYVAAVDEAIAEE